MGVPISTDSTYTLKTDVISFNLGENTQILPSQFNRGVIPEKE